MNRLVLYMDTATERTVAGFALQTDSGEFKGLRAQEIDAPRAAMSRLLPAVDEMARDSGVHVPDIGAVVVGRGPGSFTGVRIGVASAKGVAQALGVPLYGVGTLDSVAWGLVGGYVGSIGVVGDAMRGEVYPATFELTHERAQRLTTDTVMKPRDAAAMWAEQIGDGTLLLVGNGLKKHAAVFEDLMGEHAFIAPEATWWPSAYGMMGAFGEATTQGLDDGDPGALLPVYTRLSDAEENERARGGDLPPTGVAGPERAR